MDQIEIRDEFIKLGQALKLAGIAESGVDAKIMIEEEMVKVNGETETRRGRGYRNQCHLPAGSVGIPGNDGI